jgi:hypothetical protein
LQCDEVARLFHHYSELAKWYDLSDAARTYGIKVPEIALDNPLLFSAVVASSAMHLSKTSLPQARRAAEFYHSNCIAKLIELKEDDESVSSASGIALAAVCLLRAYETLSGKLA